MRGRRRRSMQSFAAAGRASRRSAGGGISWPTFGLCERRLTGGISGPRVRAAQFGGVERRGGGGGARAGAEHGAALRDLVSDQFERIEETVATMASMRDAVTRAAVDRAGDLSFGRSADGGLSRSGFPADGRAA